MSPKDGITIAYSLCNTPSVQGICFNLAKCHPDDRFCYNTGRKVAAQKLHNDGPLEVLPLEHPISDTIIDYISNTWWPSRRKYGGYGIDIFPEPIYRKGEIRGFRWLSTFHPSQQYLEGDQSDVPRYQDY